MKASRLISAVIVTAMFTFTGCQRLEELFNRDEVRFSSRTSGCGLALTRAEYSGSTYTKDAKTFYNIVWEVGDKMTIGSEKTAGQTALTYKVDRITTQGNASNATLTKDSDIGLRWGTNGDYTFYAVSPSTDYFNIFGTLSIFFPIEQVQGDGSAWDGDTYVVKPNSKYMYMTATEKVTKTVADPSPEVDLDFRFFPTVMDFILSGENDMTIKAIGLQSSQYLSGKLDLDLRIVDDEGYPKGMINDSFDKQDKTKGTSIQTVDAKGDPIVIPKGKKIRVCLFLPAYYENSETKEVPDLTDLKFSVTFVDGGEEETLTTDLKKRENESSEYKFLSFKPHLRHIIKGLILPDTISWDIEGEVTVTPWDETTEHETVFDGYVENEVCWGPGIEVNGVIWAPVNCGTWDGEYPTGKYYQWGRKYGQPISPDSVSPVDITFEQGQSAEYESTFGMSHSSYQNNWYPSNINTALWDYTSKVNYSPCPQGWHVPTLEDLESLIDAGYTIVSGKDITGTKTGNLNGYLFGTAPNQVFLPAVGKRYFDGRVLDKDKGWLYYYSITCEYNSNYSRDVPYRLTTESSTLIDNNIYSIGDGYSIRCVKNQKEDEDLPHYIDKGTDYGEGIKVKGTIWAPVNCGTSTDFPYGLLYQWGRKDGQGFNNGSSYTSEAAPTIAGMFEGTNGIYSGAKPLRSDWFYKNGSGSTYTYDWIKNGNNQFWNKAESPNDASQVGEIIPEKGDFDPCPDGWRLPTYYELKELLGTHTGGGLQNGNHGTLTNVTGKYYNGSNYVSIPTSGVFLPAAGFRDRAGSAYNRGTQGVYWSSSVNGYNGRGQTFNSSSASMSDYDRAGGYSVRCVYDGQ